MLLQETLLGSPYYPWRLSIACSLINRGQAFLATPAKEKFFKQYPAPTPLTHDELYSFFLPFFGTQTGLVASRVKTITDFFIKNPNPTNAEFFALPWVDQYTKDSWLIFVRGRRLFSPQNTELATWLTNPIRPRYDKAVTLFRNHPERRLDALDDVLFYLVRLAHKQEWSREVQILWERVLANMLQRLETQCPGWTFYKCADLLARKNYIYGNRQLTLTGHWGIAVRTVDKICRILNIAEKGIDPTQHQTEPVTDSVVDAVNYSALALLFQRGDFPCAD